MIKISYRKIFFAFLCFSPFFILTAFREYDVGIDTFRYFLEYKSAAYEFHAIRRTEPLFSYLLIAFNSLGINFRVFLIVQSFIYYLSISLLASFVSERVILAYVLVVGSFGLLSFGFSGVRQSIAMSFFFIGVYFWVHRRYGWYAVLASLAFFTHNASLIAFLVFFLVAGRFSIGSLLFYSLLFSPVLSILDLSLLKTFSGADIKQVHFLEADENLLNFKTPLSFYFISILSFLILAFRTKSYSLFERGFENTSEHIKRMVAWGVVIAACFLWMAMTVRLADRLALYFIPFAGILTAWVMSSLSKNNVNIAMKVLLLLVLIIVFFAANRTLFISIIG